MPIDKAIEAMKIHHQWLPDMIFYEPDKMSPDTREALKAMGHSLSYRRTNLGRLMGIIYDPELEVFIGANDSGPVSGYSGVSGRILIAQSIKKMYFKLSILLNSNKNENLFPI